MPDSVTQILASGPPGTKKNIAVLGDGFAAGDQTLYNNKVKELLLDGVFGHDYFYEDKQAFNIFRVNLISSAVSGEHHASTTRTARRPTRATTRSSSTTIKNTALGYIFSGSWAHCWLEGGAEHRDAGPERAQHLGAGLRPRPDHPQRPAASAAAAAAASRSSRWGRAGPSWRTSSATAPAGSPTSTARARHVLGRRARRGRTSRSTPTARR